MTKLRISAHNLAIETGRYARPTKIVAENRFCFNCKNKVESEYHMIFDCELYSEEREDFKKKLLEFTELNFDEPLSLFSELMSCNDFEIGEVFCDFINSCFAKRRQCLSIIVENNILLRPEITITKSGRTSKRPIKHDV